MSSTTVRQAIERLPPALWVAGAVLALAIIAVLSLWPMDRVSLPGGFNDKFAHLAAYAVLGIWGAWNPWRVGLPVIVVALGAYGLWLEWLQGLTPTRAFEWLDLVADLAGALSGGWIGLFLRGSRS